MIFRTGISVVYANIVWQFYGYEKDDDGYWMAVLIDPAYDAWSGKPDPTVYVRDLSGITPIKKAS